MTLRIIIPFYDTRKTASNNRRFDQSRLHGVTILEGSKVQRCKRMSVLRHKLVSCLAHSQFSFPSERTGSFAEYLRYFLCRLPDITNLHKRSPTYLVCHSLPLKPRSLQPTLSKNTPYEFYKVFR